MSSTSNKPSKAAALFAAPNPKLTTITVGLNRIAANSEGFDSYAFRNRVLLEIEKQQVRQANGFPANPPRHPTVQAAAAQEEDLEEPVKYDDVGTTKSAPKYSPEHLLADARRDANHRRTLSRNMVKSGQVRPKAVCAHHIVARGDEGALLSRGILSNWAIGINDTDNGVFLPRWATVKVRGLSKATHHGSIHTAVYHAEVYARLVVIEDEEQRIGREELRAMKSEMQRGTFRYLD